MLSFSTLTSLPFFLLLLSSVPAEAAYPGASSRRHSKPPSRALALQNRASTSYTGWSDLGCVTEGTLGKRALTEFAQQGVASLTAPACLQTCANMGYVYAGLENGNECFCADSLSNSGGQPTLSSNCAKPCSGDSSTSCGGTNYLNLYQTTQTCSTNSTSTTPKPPTTATPVVEWDSMGCYSDSSKYILQGYSVFTGANTPQFCQSTCKTAGFAYAGVEYGNQCYCGNSLVNTASSGPTSSGCDMACAGNSSLTCGGTWRIQLYKFISANATSSTVPTVNSTMVPTFNSTIVPTVNSTIVPTFNSSSVPSSAASSGYISSGPSSAASSGYISSGPSSVPSSAASSGYISSGPSAVPSSGYISSGPSSVPSSAASSGYISSGPSAVPSSGYISSGPSSVPSSAASSGYISSAPSSVITPVPSSSAMASASLSAWSSVMASSQAMSSARSSASASYYSSAMAGYYSSATSTSTSSSATPSATPSTRAYITSGDTTWADLGCVTDSNVRLLSGYWGVISAATPEACIANCKAMGFTYAATEYYSQCMCGSEIVPGLGISVPNDQCYTPCSGNSSVSCGGSYRANLYQLTKGALPTKSAVAAPAGMEYVGCYSDPSTSNRALAGTSAKSWDMTIEKCSSTCTAAGFAYSGVEYGTECYCGSSLTTTTLAPNCDMSCGGDKSEKCGGTYAISVFKSTTPVKQVAASSAPVAPSSTVVASSTPPSSPSSSPAPTPNTSTTPSSVPSSPAAGRRRWW